MVIGTRQNITVAVISDTIQANANKVTSGSVSVGNGAFIGGTVTITVNGDTGTVNSGQGTAQFSPATSESWPADVLELQSTSIAMTKSSTTTTYTNQLWVTGLSGSYSYTATYVFFIVGPKASATPVSPTAYIASGANAHKHTAVDSFGNVPPVPPTSLSARMSKTANRTLVTGQTDVLYTVSIVNTGATAITLDQIVDTMPSGATYVASSSTYDGSAIGDPASSNGVLTYNRLFTVPAGATKILTLQLTIPSTSGTYRNTAYGQLGNTKIYSSMSGTDPAFVDVTVNTTPAADLAISKTHTGTMTAGQAGTIPFTITVGNTGSLATATTNGTVTMTDTLPTGMTAASATGTNWTCSITNSSQTVTCTRADQLAIGGTYEPITINANVGASVASVATNTATVSSATLTCVRSDTLAAFSSYPPITIYVSAATTTSGSTVTNTARLCGGVRLTAIAPNIATTTNADFHFLAVPGQGRQFAITAWRVSGSSATVVRTLSPNVVYAQGGFVSATDLDGDGRLELVISTDAPFEPVMAIMSYPTGEIVSAFRPYAGSVKGIHVAVGRMAGASEPWLFMTPAEGPSSGVDVYRFAGGALQPVGRISVVEVP